MKHIEKKLIRYFEKSFSSYRHFALLLFALTIALSIPLGYSILQQQSIKSLSLTTGQIYSPTSLEDSIIVETSSVPTGALPVPGSQFTNSAATGYRCGITSGKQAVYRLDFNGYTGVARICEPYNNIHSSCYETSSGAGCYYQGPTPTTPSGGGGTTPAPGGGNQGPACGAGWCNQGSVCTQGELGPQCCPGGSTHYCGTTCYSGPAGSCGGSGSGGNTTVATNLRTIIEGMTCSDNPYRIQLLWNGSGPNWYVDISEDPTFTGWSNKRVNNVSSTYAPDGFSLGLSLEPDKTYYWRVWNGQAHSITGVITLPSCGTGGGGGGTQDTCVGDKHWWCGGKCYCQQGMGYLPECDEEVLEPQLACPTGGFYQCLNDTLSCPTAPTGTPTVSPNPTTSVPTATVTPIATTPGVTTQPTATVAPIPTATTAPNNPTATTAPNPTATTAPQPTSLPDVILAFNVRIPGIGTNTTAGQNSNPIRPTQSIEIAIYDIQDQQVKTASGNLSYDAASQSFRGTVAVHPMTGGAYTIKSRFNNSLWRGQTIQISQGTNTLSQTTFITGDIDGNNTLDLIDYNALNSCYGGRSCSNQQKADLNIDGIVDEKDLNILLDGFATRQGD